MIEYCDFDQQHTVQTENGNLRPDMIVKLPNHKTIVVDSKAPLSAYLESLEAETDELRSERLEHHASQIRKHVDGLSSKAYWSQIDCTPEFVVMFIPGEVFFSAALEKDPELIEYGVNNKVIIATPTSLIAVLKSVAYGWSQEHIAEHAQEVKDLGIELYDRTLIFAENFVKCGKDLSKTIESYNKAAGSLESRLLVTTRRFKELEVTNEKEIEGPDKISKMVKNIQVKELKKGDDTLDS
jgi:DNA recombination protein RmuC